MWRTTWNAIRTIAAQVPAELGQHVDDRQGVPRDASGELPPSLSEAERYQVEQLPNEAKKWGLLGVLGVKKWLQPIDDALRSPFFPYGFSGVMMGAALVFFAYIGFDSISTHAEEAVRPQRDVPIGILASLDRVYAVVRAGRRRDHGHGALSGD